MITGERINSVSNSLQIIKSEPTKENMTALVRSYLDSNHNTALEKYLNIKSVEFIVKTALSDKEFRQRVKEDYLERTSGELTKAFILGTEIKTVSQVKKNELNKVYAYSGEVEKLENEVRQLKQELKFKEDRLKGLKLYEINNGTAKQLDISVMPDNILDDFNLSISFKEK